MGIYFVQEHFGVRVCSKPIPLYDVKINTIDIKVVAMIIIIIITNRQYCPFALKSRGQNGVPMVRFSCWKLILRPLYLLKAMLSVYLQDKLCRIKMSIEKVAAVPINDHFWL